MYSIKVYLNDVRRRSFLSYIHLRTHTKLRSTNTDVLKNALRTCIRSPQYSCGSDSIWPLKEEDFSNGLAFSLLSSRAGSGLFGQDLVVKTFLCHVILLCAVGLTSEGLAFTM